jgi:hypothetical protein
MTTLATTVSLHGGDAWTGVMTDALYHVATTLVITGCKVFADNGLPQRSLIAQAAVRGHMAATSAQPRPRATRWRSAGSGIEQSTTDDRTAGLLPQLSVLLLQISHVVGQHAGRVLQATEDHQSELLIWGCACCTGEGSDLLDGQQAALATTLVWASRVRQHAARRDPDTEPNFVGRAVVSPTQLGQQRSERTQWHCTRTHQPIIYRHSQNAFSLLR